jgi:hypothetical protein
MSDESHYPAREQRGQGEPIRHAGPIVAECFDRMAETSASKDAAQFVNVEKTSLKSGQHIFGHG